MKIIRKSRPLSCIQGVSAGICYTFSRRFLGLIYTDVTKKKVYIGSLEFVEIMTREMLKNDKFVFFLLGYSPASEFYVPTFRNPLPVPSS